MAYSRNVQCICYCTLSAAVLIYLSFHQRNFPILGKSGGPLVYFCFSSSKKGRCEGEGERCGPLLLFQYSKETPNSSPRVWCRCYHRAIQRAHSRRCIYSFYSCVIGGFESNSASPDRPHSRAPEGLLYEVHCTHMKGR
jgi:hypothetical protein